MYVKAVLIPTSPPRLKSLRRRERLAEPVRSALAHLFGSADALGGGCLLVLAGCSLE